MEDKRIQVMTILQDYFCRDTPLDVATDSILRLFSVVGRSEQFGDVSENEELPNNDKPDWNGNCWNQI